MLGRLGALVVPTFVRPPMSPFPMSITELVLPLEGGCVGVGVGVGVGVVDERGVVWAGTYMGSPVRLSTMEA